VEDEEGEGEVDTLPPRILNITVPQVGHLPLMALRPFFIVSSTASVISFLALHLTQYPSAIREFGFQGVMALKVTAVTLRVASQKRQPVKPFLNRSDL
jgi:hypothetical protein